MKTLLHSSKFLQFGLLIFVLFFGVNTAHGQGVFTSNAASGNWNVAGTWTFTGSDVDGVPDADDSVTIINFKNVIVTANAACSALTINGNSNNNRTLLTINSGTVLSVGGAFTTIAGTGNREVGLTVNGTMQLASTATFASGSNAFYLIGSSGTFDYNGTTQTVAAIPSTPYVNLILSNSGNKTISTGITVNGVLSMQGTAAAITNAPTFGAASTLEYNGTANPQVATAIEFPSASGPRNLLINSTNGVSLGLTRTVAGSITLTGGGLTIAAGNTLTSASTGSLIVASGKVLTIANTAFLINQATTTMVLTGASAITIAAGGTYVHHTVSGGIATPLGNFNMASTSNFIYRGTTGAVPNTSFSGKTYGGNLSFETTSGAYTVTASGGSALAIGGNLTIGSNVTVDFATGGGLTANVNVAGSTTVTGVFTTNATGQLITAGSVSIAGTLTMNSDVTVGGDWTVAAAGVQNNNSKAVFFNGTGTQTIAKTAGGSVTFAYLVQNKASGDIVISSSPATDVIIPSTAGAVFQMNNAGQFDLNGRTLTLSGTGGNIQVNTTARTIKSGPTDNVAGGKIAITGTKVVTNSAGSGTLSLGVNVTTILTAGLNFGTNLTTVNGTLQINSGGSVTTNAPIYASGSLLNLNTGGSFALYNNGGANEAAGWYRNTPSTGSAQTGVPWNFSITNSTAVTWNSISDGNPRYLNGDVSIGTGSSFTLGTASLGDLYVRGNFANSGTFSANGRLVVMNGAGPKSLSGTLTGSSAFEFLTINKSSGNVNLSNDVTVNTTLTLTAGNLDVTNKILLLGPTANAIGGSFSNSTMIVADGGGEVRKSATSNVSASYTFPIGDGAASANGAEYTPITLVTTGGAYSSAYIGVSVSDTKNSSNASQTDYLTRFWNVNQAGITSCLVTVTGTYINSANDFAGTLGNIRAAQLDGTFNPATNPWIKSGGSILSGSTLTYTGATIVAGRISAFTGISSADPTVSITGGGVTVCQNGTATLSAVPVGDTPTYTYSWTGPITGSTTSATATATTSAVGGPNSYAVTVKDGNGISSATSSSVTVTVAALPVAGTLTPSPAAGSVCPGTSVSAAAPGGSGGTGTIADELQVSVSGAGYVAYLSGDPINTTGQTSVSIRTRRTATGTGCTTSGYNTVTWNMYTLPTASVTSNNTPICYNTTATFTITGTSGAIVTYNFNGAGNLTATLTGGTVNLTLPNATANTVLNLVSVANTCTAILGTSSTVFLTTATTWTGGTSIDWTDLANWSCGLPTSAYAVTIGTGTFQPQIATDPTIASLTVNSGASLKVLANHDLTVTNAIVNNGIMTVENDANLIQTNDVNNTGSGTTIVNRNSASIMRQDYTLWSSPVEGQQLQAFSPMTLSNRFYTYDNNGDVSAANDIYIGETATNNFAEGVGYLIRVANNHPNVAVAWPGVFTGTEAHNGTKTFTTNSGAYYAVGNPYPSAINADTFISDNSLTDALYFWRKTNNPFQSTLPTSTYATYTYAGGVGNGDPNPDDPAALEPNGFIQVGQGFIAQAASTQLSFNNLQRVGDNSGRFLRNAEVERHRIWLSLSNSVSGINKMMVAYMTGATQSVDAAIDGRYFNDSPTALNSLVNSEEFTIQGRALPFDAADIVPLAFKTINAGDYTITLDHFDGLFSADQDILLKDNLTATVNNLRTAPYTFATEAGVFNSRFEIIYQAPLAIAQPAFTTDKVVVYKQNENVVINSGRTQMSKVLIYDIRGRLLIEKDHINAAEIRIATGTTNQVLIVKIISDKNETVTKKVVN
jgi:hypothetical protein